MPDEIATIDGLCKAEDLEIYLVDDQCVVYDTVSDRMHYLNPTAALVLEFCDGNRSVAEIATLVQEAYGLPVAPVDDVSNCLRSLKEMEVVR